jgi:hypothetical protein
VSIVGITAPAQGCCKLCTNVGCGLTFAMQASGAIQHILDMSANVLSHGGSV